MPSCGPPASPALMSLAGRSYGGLITRLYAGEYPSEVAGIVFVDAFAPQWQTAFTPQQWQILTAITGPSQEQLAKYPAMERINIDASGAQARAAAPLRCSLPVVVLSRDTRTNPMGPVIASAVAQHKLPAFVPKDFGYISDRVEARTPSPCWCRTPGTSSSPAAATTYKSTTPGLWRTPSTTSSAQHGSSKATSASSKPDATQTGRPSTAAGAPSDQEVIVQRSSPDPKPVPAGGA